MEKKEHILLAITGLSPQVVTETIYALYKAKKTLPTRIIILTTLRGAEEVNTHLIKEGKLEALRKDYDLPMITLDSKDVLVIPDANGDPINDAKSQSDHVAMSNFISSKVREISANKNCTIHASIAGGRKTMTFFLGYAMSLYGRRQDTLSHILVTEGFESSQFFYPTPYSHQIYLRTGSRDAKDADVMLAEIPFVRLREEIPQRLLDGTASYSETVEWLNKDLKNEKLVLDTDYRTVIFCGQECQLTPIDFAFYWWFCERAKDGEPALSIPSEVEADVCYGIEFLSFYRNYLDAIQLEEIETGHFKKGMGKNFFEERKSRVGKSLVNAFGERLAKAIQIKKSDKVERKFLFAVNRKSHLIEIIE